MYSVLMDISMVRWNFHEIFSLCDV